MPSKRRPPLPAFSVVVTARNEARSLPNLIESLSGFLSAGGELVVLDTGSRDGTPRVASRAGARVERAGDRFHSLLSRDKARAINRRFARAGEGPLVEPGQLLFDFGRAREHASSLAGNDFVWHIDASDVVLAADFEFLNAQIRSGRVSSFLYLLHLGPTAFHVARFYDRRLFAWKGRVHEVPMRTSIPSEATRLTCNEDQLSLRHDRAKKKRNYFAGLALDAIESPKSQRSRHYLGRELYYMQRYRSAIAVLRPLGRRKTGWEAERGESMRLIGVCQEALGRIGPAARSYFQAFRIDPTRRQPLLHLAALCQNLGDFEGSVTCAAASLTAPRSNPFLTTNENQETDPHAFLYWGLFWLGRRDEARLHWQKCRDLDPGNEKFAADARLFSPPRE